MLTLETVSDITGFRSLKEEWNSLLKDSKSDCLFLTWEWTFTWWKHLSKGCRLNIVLLRNRGELVAIAPLVITPRKPSRLLPFKGLGFLGNGTVGSDYLDIIVRRGHESRVIEVLTAHFRSRELTLEFSRVRAGSFLDQFLIPSLLPGSWAVERYVTDECPYITLSGKSWESYLAETGRSHRANVRRRLNGLERRFQVRFEQAEEEPQRSLMFLQFLDLHGQRWEQMSTTDEMRCHGMTDFHDEMSSIALENGWLRLFVLYLDNKPAASVYAFSYRRITYFYQSGFRPDLATFSVGLAAMALTIKNAIEEDTIEYDFLHGNESYKFLWAKSVRKLTRFRCYPLTVKGVVHQYTMELRNQVKKIVRWPQQLPST